MTPLEAVARALHAHAQDITPFDDLTALRRDLYFGRARAAIIALADKLNTDTVEAFRGDADAKKRHRAWKQSRSYDRCNSERGQWAINTSLTDEFTPKTGK